MKITKLRYLEKYPPDPPDPQPEPEPRPKLW